MQFISEFYCPSLVRIEFRNNVLFSLSRPFSSRFGKDIAWKRFFYFLNFFAIFFGIFFLGSSMNGIRDQNFFLPFSAYLIPFWLKIMPERGFLSFLNFFAIFLLFSCQGRVWTEFWTKIFFSLSRPISSRFG